MSFFFSVHRFLIGQYVTIHGDVVSHVNISRVSVEDGGLYQCKVVNRAGSDQHSARLNIYGKTSISRPSEEEEFLQLVEMTLNFLNVLGLFESLFLTLPHVVIFSVLSRHHQGFYYIEDVLAILY